MRSNGENIIWKKTKDHKGQLSQRSYVVSITPKFSRPKVQFKQRSNDARSIEERSNAKRSTEALSFSGSVMTLMLCFFTSHPSAAGVPHFRKHFLHLSTHPGPPLSTLQQGYFNLQPWDLTSPLQQTNLFWQPVFVPSPSTYGILQHARNFVQPFSPFNVLQQAYLKLVKECNTEIHNGWIFNTYQNIV